MLILYCMAQRVNLLARERERERGGGGGRLAKFKILKAVSVWMLNWLLCPHGMTRVLFSNSSNSSGQTIPCYHLRRDPTFRLISAWGGTSATSSLCSGPYCFKPQLVLFLLITWWWSSLLWISLDLYAAFECLKCQFQCPESFNFTENDWKKQLVFKSQMHMVETFLSLLILPIIHIHFQARSQARWYTFRYLRFVQQYRHVTAQPSNTVVNGAGDHVTSPERERERFYIWFL